jgi:hypothetical protein
MMRLLSPFALCLLVSTPVSAAAPRAVHYLPISFEYATQAECDAAKPALKARAEAVLRTPAALAFCTEFGRPEGETYGYGVVLLSESSFDPFDQSIATEKPFERALTYQWELESRLEFEPVEQRILSTYQWVLRSADVTTQLHPESKEECEAQLAARLEYDDMKDRQVTARCVETKDGLEFHILYLRS